jgi:hypothetical protein
VTPDVVGNVVVLSVGNGWRCVGSSMLESSDCGRGAAGSSSEDLRIRSLSEGRLSPSNSCMSGRAILR